MLLYRSVTSTGKIPPELVKARHCKAHCSKLGEDGQGAKNQKQRGSFGAQKGAQKDSHPAPADQLSFKEWTMWTLKTWTMTSNHKKLSRVENPCDWQSCRCDGTSNGGTSHRLQGERHPLQPLWTLFSTLSWNVWRCQHSDNSEQLVSIWIGSCQSTLPRLSHHLSSVELCFGWHTVPVSSVLGL